MSQGRARLGDTTSHGGTITTASFTVLVDGIGCARVGDVHVCPQHGTNAIVTGSSGVFADGRPVARLGDLTGCSATIVRASTDVTAGGGSGGGGGGPGKSNRGAFDFSDTNTLLY